MDIQQLGGILCNIFGEKNVKPHSKNFRIIVDYNNMPYCVVLSLEKGRLIMNRDAVDEEQENYEDAYKMAYKMLIGSKDRMRCEIVI